MLLFSVLCYLALTVEPLGSVFGSDGNEPEAPTPTPEPPKYQYTCVCKTLDDGKCDNDCLDSADNILSSLENCFTKPNCNSVKIFDEQYFNFTYYFEKKFGS